MARIVAYNQDMQDQKSRRKWVVLHKKRGETPLEVLEKWREANPAYVGAPMSYAGRLDPMAEGKLLVLIGDECKRQSAYTKLDKEYDIEVLLDVKTDTGDVLGFPDGKAIEAGMLGKRARSGPLGQVLPSFSEHARLSAFAREIGSHSRRYPVFSSKTVDGKPLFLYALEGALDTIRIPEHIETIYRIRQLGSYTLTRDELHNRITSLLANVSRSDEPSKLLGADFRQDAIRTKWSELFTVMPEHSFTVLRLRVTCASGAYMRTLAERIGASLGTSALALTINRTKLGTYLPLGPFGLWIRRY
ncbi:MAG: hypothetical protein P4M11_04970 [Candidatus Pacebacteria bacterium]|nr:hypothetical protein [Candidatus Paceibacterota bacterium]